MRRGRRPPLIDEGTENFWPSFADLTSTVTLIFFVLMLLAYMQNLIAGRNLEAATRRLAESRRQIGDAEGRLRVLEGQLRATTAEIEAGQTRLRASEERVDAGNRELASVRARLQGIAVLRVDVLNKVKSSLEGELGGGAAAGGGGAPARVAVADNGNILINESLVFEYNSYTIKPEGKRLLANLAKAFARVLADPAVRENVDVILVQGHTDERGTTTYNRELSAKRANAVLSYMFETDRALEQSYGAYFASSAYSEFRPLNPAKTEAAYEQNRRIEISVVLKDASVRGVIDEYMRTVGSSASGAGGRGAATP
ncbi:MAG TPA: OmpA family protein [Polyangia bacterium]